MELLNDNPIGSDDKVSDLEGDLFGENWASDAVIVEEDLVKNINEIDDISTLDPEILDEIKNEVEELSVSILKSIRDLKIKESDSQVKELLRALHTLKGNAKMAGLSKIGTICHEMESLMQKVADGDESLDVVIIEIENYFDEVSVLWSKIFEIKKEENDLEFKKQQYIRVGTDLIDGLVNDASEVRLTSASLAGSRDSIVKALSDLEKGGIRLTEMIRELDLQAENQILAIKANESDDEGFDPLEFDRYTRTHELTKFISESVDDVVELHNLIMKIIKDEEVVLAHQDQITSSMQGKLMNVRLIKLKTIEERLYTTVRSAAKELDKEVDFELIGGDIEIDRGVLDRMVAPLEHILRNAVAHGIESTKERKASGKDGRGQIKLKARHEGNLVFFRIEDDGAGLNLSSVKKKAIEKGLISRDEVLNEQEMIDLIFMPGFSTADKVSEVAGRGVGMDVVKNEIGALGGQIEVKTKSGKGMAFELLLPVSLATTQAVLLSIKDDLWAIPTELIDEIKAISKDELEQALKSGTMHFYGKDIVFESFNKLVGEKDEIEVKKNNCVIFLSAGAKQMALWVETMIGTKEIVVKQLGKQLTRVNGLTGATIMGDGSLVVIVNPVFLMSHLESKSLIDDTVEIKIQIPTIMVVDDSLTIRKATSKLLERAGYVVVLAKDGVEALEKLEQVKPHVILSDVEMPRMDGFEFLKSIKEDKRYLQIPVIMITSRIAEKHKNTGLNLGANVYLGKPYKEDELLSHIDHLMAGVING